MDFDFHDSVLDWELLLLLKDRRSLSTSRVWNLFKLFWLLPVLGGEQLTEVFVGLVTKELLEFLDEVLENWYREAAELTWCKFLCDGVP